MDLWGKLKGEFIDIIQWLDESGDTLVYRFDRYGNEIKYGAKLVVRESQVAVFVNEGKLADVFQPGTYTLETQNMPIMTTINSWKYGFNSPFKAEVYFVSMKTFTDNKWGTKNPIMLRDPEFGPIRLRAFGSYSMRAKDAAAIVRGVSGTNGTFTIDGITEQLKNLIITRFTDVLGKSKIPALDLASNYVELGDFVKKNIAPEFENYGIEITTMLIENISLPPEVEEALDKRSSMGIIGNLNAYTQFQAANAMEAAAKTPGSGAGEGMGMGMGFAMANQMAQSMGGGFGNNNQFNNQQPPSFNQAPPPMQPVVSFHANINGQQFGPLDMATLQTMVNDGRIKNDTLVWKQGMSEWKPAGQVAEISSIFAQVPPPVVAPPPVVSAPPVIPPPVVTAPKIEYFVTLDGQQAGPFDIPAIQQMIGNGKVSKETLVWKNGLANWLPAKDASELTDLFPKTVTPPPVVAPPPVVVMPPSLSKVESSSGNISFKEISKGQKLSVSTEVGALNFKVAIEWDNTTSSDYEVTPSAFLLSSREKLEKEENFVFYNNKKSPDSSVTLEENSDPNKLGFSIDLSKCSSDVEKILLVLTIDDGDSLNKRAENLKNLTVKVFNSNGVDYKVHGLTQETAIILIDFYKRNGEWKFQGVGNGFNSGLSSILKEYASENVSL